MKLYDFLPSGNGYKCRLLLNQLDIPYQRVELDIDKGKTRTPDFLAKNPVGRIPTLELDDGTYLPESNAIIFYLAEGTPFLAADRLGRAQTLQWLFFEQYNHEPNIATSRYWLTHGFEMTAERKMMLIMKKKGGLEALGVMEKHLARNDYFVGGRYSIADIALYAYTHVAEEGDFPLGPYPAVRAWLKRVADQPRYIPITRG